MPTKYKKLTHVFAVAVVFIAGFFMSPAGEAIAKQYPILVPIVAGITTIAAVYRQPRQS